MPALTELLHVEVAAAVLVDAEVADERVGVVDRHILEVDAQVSAELLHADLARAVVVDAIKHNLHNVVVTVWLAELQIYYL